MQRIYNAFADPDRETIDLKKNTHVLNMVYDKDYEDDVELEDGVFLAHHKESMKQVVVRRVRCKQSEYNRINVCISFK